MKTSLLRLAAVLLLSMTLSQCVVAPVPEPILAPGPGPIVAPVAAYRPAYGTPYYGGGYYGGYGATGRVASNAMWAGARAYGIHERNETRDHRIDARSDRINHRIDHGVRNYHRPAGGGGYRGGARPPRGGHR